MRVSIVKSTRSIMAIAFTGMILLTGCSGNTNAQTTDLGKSAVTSSAVMTDETHKTAEKPEPKPQKISQRQEAISAVSNVYGIKKQNLKAESIKKQDDFSEFTVVDDNSHQYTVVYSSESEVEQIRYSEKGISSHKKDVSLKNQDLTQIYEKIEKRVKKFTSKEISSSETYALMSKKDQLAYGTITVYCEMGDQSGCVAVYSTVYDEVCELYTNDIKSIKDEIAAKIKSAEKNQYTYENLKMKG